MNWRNLLLVVVMSGASAPAREWHSADGSRTVEAQFAGLQEGTLLLKAADGPAASYPLSAFATEDQQFAQQAQVTLEAAVKAKPLNFEVSQMLPEGLLCRVITELPKQRGTWVVGGEPFLVLPSSEVTAERGTKVMAQVLYHAGTRTFQMLDGSSVLINAYSLALDEAVSTARQIQTASGGDPAQQAPLVMEPLIEIITTRGLGLSVGKGFFITDADMLKGAKSIALHHGGKDVTAQVVKTAAPLGLALLSCEVAVEPGKFLPRKPMELGQNMFVVGLTLTAGGKSYATPALSKGIISRTGGAHRFEHDATVDEKNVGGYVLGEKGDVLGVFFAAQSRVQGKRSSQSAASGATTAAKGLTECLRSEALEQLLVSRGPGVPTLKPGTNGDAMEAAVAALRKSSVIVVATREERKTPPPKAAGTMLPPGAATGWSLSKSSNTRHNSNCRYYNANNACQAADGKPCKICGG